MHYSNQTHLLSLLKKIITQIEEDPVRPAETTVVRRVHKLDQRIDGEQIARIVAEYEAGTSAAVIGGTFNLSKRSIIKILREAGVEIRLPRMSEVEIQEATRLYASGLSLVDVGKRLDRDHSTIYKTLRRAGVRMRDTHGRN